MENKKTWREKLGVFLICTGSIVFVAYFIILGINGYLSGNSIIPQVSGSVGSFIGGVAGSMWALGGILFLYETLYFQRVEFKLTRDNFVKNQKETTFFNLISQLNELISFISGEVEIDGKKSRFQGRTYLHNVFKSFKSIHTKEVSK